MGGITCNAEGFAGETGAVNVLEGGERDTNDLLRNIVMARRLGHSISKMANLIGCFQYVVVRT